MKKIICFIEIILVSIIMLDVKALTACTDDEMARVKELAQNVKFQPNYEVAIEDRDNEVFDIYYNVKVLNLDKDLKVVYKVEDYDEVNDKVFSKDIVVTEDNFEIEDLGIGKKTFYIYSYTANLCTEKLLRTVTIDLPKYNEYYHFNQEKCQANPDFEYCKEFMEIDKNFEEIDTLFEKYLKKENNVILNENNLKWYIIGGVIVIGSVGIISIVFIIRKRNKKDDI